MKSCSQPAVTVIVPVYKVERYLSRCVDSILDQSFPDFEIILVDDGSPDRCPALCDAYREKDDRVVVIHKPNGGLSSARNAGMRIAKGEYLCFVDSDDYIMPDMIEQLTEAAAGTGAPVSCCSFTSDEALLDRVLTRQFQVFTAAEAMREILRDGAICTSAWAKLYERSLFDGIDFPEGSLYEDYGTTYKLFHRAGRVAFADTKKYYYTYNAAGITKSAFSSGQMDYFTVSEELEHFARENYPGLEKLVRARETDMAVSLLRKLSCTPERDRFAREEKGLVKAVRRDVLGFLFSRYPAAKKLSALALSAFPHLTLELFAALFSSR